MEYLEQIGKRAKQAASVMGILGQNEKNAGLLAAADALLLHENEIIKANDIDITQAYENNMKEALIDRLRLSHDRIEAMAEGLRQIVSLHDPVGEMISMENRPNGLQVIQKRVPLGVIGIIYESRPNVTADAFGLCFKAGNAVILRGGSDAIYSNKAIVKVLKEALAATKVMLNGVKISLPEDAILLIEDISRETATAMMRMNQYIDVLIPRGGTGLIQSVIANSTVPVIETGIGNCHIYVDKDADFSMALGIIINAKTQRLGVCNTCESLVVHSGIAKEFLPKLYECLKEYEVIVRADEKAREICPQFETAEEADFLMEYLDKLISLKIVDSIEDAIVHINHYNTGHSEAIITSNYGNALKFTNEIDAAAVYVNASTRFTDGFEFGFGAEIGISTQKLHARGPMGLKELTSTKYVIFGNGQIR